MRSVAVLITLPLLGVILVACGGSESKDAGATVLFADQFTGAFPGTTWTTSGLIGVDVAAGVPPPSIHVAGGAFDGAALTNASFPTTGGLTVRVKVKPAATTAVVLNRPDSSTFLELNVLAIAPPNNLFFNAAGVSGTAALANDAQFHTFEFRILATGTVQVLLDGTQIGENAAPSNPQPTTRLILSRGASGDVGGFDDVLITTP